MRPKISVVMVVKNEEKRIGAALDTVVDWADEIVVVDDESSDGTISVARKYTDKIFSRKWDLKGRY